MNRLARPWGSPLIKIGVHMCRDAAEQFWKSGITCAVTLLASHVESIDQGNPDQSRQNKKHGRMIYDHNENQFEKQLKAAKTALKNNWTDSITESRSSTKRKTPFIKAISIHWEAK